MSIKSNIQKFIENYIKLINENDWDEVYKLINYNCIDYCEVGEFTKAMLDCGINPLPYMERVPSAYLYNVEKPELDIYIPEGIKYISQLAFYDCNIKSLHISKSIKDIDTDGFALPRHVPIYITYNDFEEFSQNVTMNVIDWEDYILISSITGDEIWPISFTQYNKTTTSHHQTATLQYVKNALNDIAHRL